MSASAASLTFTAAVAPRAVRARTRTVVRAAGRARVTSAAVEKINVNDVKDHLDRGFVLVDIRDPEECAETGYKSSWKNIVVRTRTFPRFASRGPHPRARTRGNAKTWRLQGRPFLPSGKPTARFLNLSGYRSARPVRRRARDETCVAPMKRFLLTRAAFLFILSSQLAAMDEDGAIHMNPNFLAQIRQEFPNSMSRILIACDDGTFRSEKAAAAIVDKCGFTQVKIIDGGIDAYIAAFPLTDADKIKWRMRPEIGEDLSVLVSGVDTRQQGQKYY
jgi:rhodanese-related sulfurtransferase